MIVYYWRKPIVEAAVTTEGNGFEVVNSRLKVVSLKRIYALVELR